MPLSTPTRHGRAPPPPHEVAAQSVPHARHANPNGVPGRPQDRALRGAQQFRHLWGGKLVSRTRTATCPEPGRPFSAARRTPTAEAAHTGIASRGPSAGLPCPRQHARLGGSRPSTHRPAPGPHDLQSRCLFQLVLAVNCGEEKHRVSGPLSRVPWPPPPTDAPSSQRAAGLVQPAPGPRAPARAVHQGSPTRCRENHTRRLRRRRVIFAWSSSRALLVAWRSSLGNTFHQLASRAHEGDPGGRDWPCAHLPAGLGAVPVLPSLFLTYDDTDGRRTRRPAGQGDRALETVSGWK